MRINSLQPTVFERDLFQKLSTFFLKQSSSIESFTLKWIQRKKKNIHITTADSDNL